MSLILLVLFTFYFRSTVLLLALFHYFIFLLSWTPRVCHLHVVYVPHAIRMHTGERYIIDPIYSICVLL